MRIWALILAILLLMGCGSFDQERLRPLYRAGIEVESTSFYGDDERLRAALRKLDVEIETASDFAQSEGEATLVRLYRDAWTACSDVKYNHEVTPPLPNVDQVSAAVAKLEAARQFYLSEGKGQ